MKEENVKALPSLTTVKEESVKDFDKGNRLVVFEWIFLKTIKWKKIYIFFNSYLLVPDWLKHYLSISCSQIYLHVDHYWKIERKSLYFNSYLVVPDWLKQYLSISTQICLHIDHYSTIDRKIIYIFLHLFILSAKNLMVVNKRLV